MTDAWRYAWQPGTIGDAFGDTLFKRATGELPEMESSKAAARRLAPDVQAGDRILDVGCGVGHYLVSLDRTLKVDFSYQGVDATSAYIESAREAFKGRETASFDVADIFALPFDDNSYDIVMCNNVFLHLPSIATPLRELCRVAKRRVLVRSLIGDKSYRIQKAQRDADGNEVFGADDTVAVYSYFNIYSTDYIDSVLSKLPRVTRWNSVVDEDFDSSNINKKNFSHMVGEWQVSGYVLLPWRFLEIELD
jgi:ubiquinone/menaquinone biosynthesis C-methylase UbiE